MIQFTEAMIIKGLEQGLVNLILSPHGDGIVCKIGKGTCSNWFYFGGVTAAECNNVEEYKKQVPQATIIEELIRVLNDFHHIDEDEQLFYYYVLKDSKAMSIHDVSEKCDYWISEAMKQLIKDATLGISKSQFELGLCFYRGENVKQDYSRAIYWFKKAASDEENKNYDAIYYLGVCFKNGFGCDKNHKEAIKYFKEAANNGNKYAQYNMGTLLYLGEQIKTDYQEAFKYFKDAAEQGLLEAMYNTAVCYADGTGVERNPDEAFKWYLETCKQKYPMGQFSVGRCFEFGLGTPEFDEMAFFWYQRSANQGYNEAMFSLASCYERGYGVEQDDNKAGYWYNKAAKSGHQDAIKMMQNYKKVMINKFKRIK